MSNDVIIVDYSKMTMEEREAYAIARVKEKQLAEKKRKRANAKSKNGKKCGNYAFYGTRHGTGVVQGQLCCTNNFFGG